MTDRELLLLMNELSSRDQEIEDIKAECFDLKCKISDLNEELCMLRVCRGEDLNKIKAKVISGLGKERVVDTFLFFPKHLNGETRWLKKVKIVQRYETWEDAWEAGTFSVTGWVDKAFI